MRLVYVFACVILTILPGCEETQKNGDKFLETLTKGAINITIDESFKPVFQEVIKVFLSSYPDAKLNVAYKSEANCLKDWYNDSVRLIFSTKRLGEEELKLMEDKLEFKPAHGVSAYDAIAVIVNRKNRDTLFDIKEIKEILTGNNKNYIPIVDGLNESSVLRYIKENILNNEPYFKELKGSANSADLLDNVHNNTNAIGFIGVSWVGNKDDSFQISFNNKIKIASIECKNCNESNIYVKPYQANLLQNKYPFIREISYVLKENYNGLGRGVVNFVNNERGQLIFKRSYLIPAKVNFNIRSIKIKTH